MARLIKSATGAVVLLIVAAWQAVKGKGME